jgi:hypothetical protein
MRKIYLLLALLIATATSTLRAQFTIEGLVQDTSGNPLSSATIALLQASDSVLVSFALTDEYGSFIFKKVSEGDYLVQASFLGYHTMSVPTDVASNLSLPAITMIPNTVSLDEVSIEGERTPIFIKKDTIEYNALAFKTNPGDNVEQLLKRLPGVEVDREGNVKAMGEDVQKVLVDGKEFFGNDPKVATKNLPADAVDRVQVYDRKSDLAEFTGIDDGEREKTINLKLKEDKKKGVFGNVTGGYGQTNFDDPDHLYQGKVSVNRFSNKLQLSVLGMLNNNNQQGFSVNEYINFMGGLSSMMGSGGGRIRLGSSGSGIPLNTGGDMGTGFMRTGAGGVNFNYDISKKTEIQTSYFYNDLSNTLDQSTFRQQFLNNGVFETNSESSQLTANNNHRVNVTVRHEIDSMQNLIFRSNAGINDAMLTQNSMSQTFDNEGSVENESTTNNASNGQNLNATATLVYRRRFHKRGRALVLEANGSMQQDDQEAALFSVNGFRPGTDKAFTDSITQDQFQTNDQTNWGAKVSFTEPLGKSKYLQLNYSRQNYNNDWNREVYDINGGTTRLNRQLSNEYLRGYFYDRGGLSLLMNGAKSTLTASMDVQRSQLDGDLITLDTMINQSFVNVLPGLRYRYEFAATRNISLNYRTSVREPSLEQLQPIIDNTNPLNIYVGNPNLRPEYTHSANIHFMNFSRFNFTNFFGVVRATYTTNKITNSKIVDSLFRQITQPINVDQDLSLSTFINYGAPIKPIGAKFRIEGNVTYNRSILFVNTLENNVNRLMGGLSLTLENRNKEHFDLVAGARLSPTLTRYDISVELNQDFLNQSYFTDLSVNLGKKWLFTSSLDYTLYGGDVFNEDASIALWEAALTRYLFKNRRGQLRLTAYDILNQNQGIDRTSTFNYVEETRVRTLSRYVMMTFTYNLSEFGEQQGGGKFMITTRRR